MYMFTSTESRVESVERVVDRPAEATRTAVVVVVAAAVAGVDVRTRTDEMPVRTEAVAAPSSEKVSVLAGAVAVAVAVAVAHRSHDQEIPSRVNVWEEEAVVGANPGAPVPAAWAAHVAVSHVLVGHAVLCSREDTHLESADVPRGSRGRGFSRRFSRHR